MNGTRSKQSAHYNCHNSDHSDGDGDGDSNGDQTERRGGVRNVQRLPIDDGNDDEYARKLTRSFLVSCCRSLRPAGSNEPR